MFLAEHNGKQHDYTVITCLGIIVQNPNPKRLGVDRVFLHNLVSDFPTKEDDRV